MLASFEHVTAKIYVVDLSKLECLADAVCDLVELTHNKWFRGTNTFLFLNKLDLFKTPSSAARFTKVFPDYTGSSDWKERLDFVQEMFLAKVSTGWPVFVHCLVAVDSNDYLDVFNSLKGEKLQCRAGVLTPFARDNLETGNERRRL